MRLTFDAVYSHTTLATAQLLLFLLIPNLVSQFDGGRVLDCLPDCNYQVYFNLYIVIIAYIILFCIFIIRNFTQIVNLCFD